MPMTRKLWLEGYLAHVLMADKTVSPPEVQAILKIISDEGYDPKAAYEQAADSRARVQQDWADAPTYEEITHS